jgi:branched-chain amino acid transport system ATP-binding protein
MADPLLNVTDVGKRFGGFVALDAIDLSVAPGERVGLIGPNGSGKSTLVNCICGTLQNESGTVHFDGRAVDGLAAHRRTVLGLARSFQLPRPFVSLSVADNLRVPLLYAVKARLGPAVTAAELDDRCSELLGLVGLGHKAGKWPRDLTQVEMRKLELARAMAARPKLLISDEAMAGLAGAEVDEVLRILFDLNARGITIIMIEHIMQAVMRFSQRVVCLVAGQIICEGAPEQIVQNPEVQRAYLGA